MHLMHSKYCQITVVCVCYQPKQWNLINMEFMYTYVYIYDLWYCVYACTS